MKKIIIASNNKGKIREIRAIIGEQDIELLDLKDIGFTDEITEDGYSIKENAVKKGLSVMKAVGELTIADDSGLEVDAIDGQPGVLSARFSGEGATDESNNRKLLELLSNIPMEKRGAQFRCVMALIYPNGRILTAEGICRGRIAYKPIGDKGFGYDPIFIPNGYDKTFSQLGSHVKNQISHRAIALYKMKGIMIREGLIV
ncbi:MAG: RdgB/HAM1 family non-canonical purine NTP pyrophosphatase [Clostridiales bacterium]|jgi:XTP/dITP diphosphohydrolase|nr:RdgB/HAM1 family non-canonical purine NTP pyrophosphatase [Clostridiales bacterium]